MDFRWHLFSPPFCWSTDGSASYKSRLSSMIAPYNWIHRVLILALLFLATPDSAWAQNLEIRFLDIGQGDAVLIRNGGKAALIDAGPSDRVATQLKVLGVKSLDLLVASHNHADHIGGADAVLESIPVRF